MEWLVSLRGFGSVRACLFATSLIVFAGSASSTPVKAMKSFRDCAHCPEMVELPAGSFTMGAALELEKAFDVPENLQGRSLPLHTVTFAKPFAMAVYPVTVAEFRAFVEETGYEAADACHTQYMNDGHFIYEEAKGYSWRAPGFPQDDRHPVVCVSAEDGEAYAAWLSRKTGHRYGLPSEAQYEYAARAGTTTAFFWGDRRDAVACKYSNQPDLDQADALGAPAGPEYRFQCRDGYAYTSPVDNYAPNPWGLYDMLGNIWEWVGDCWNENYLGAPSDGSAWLAGDCDARASRGGSYGNAAFSTYAGVRVPRHSSYVGHSWGFRVVRND
jgi:formylglycine-generating enzyme